MPAGADTAKLIAAIVLVIGGIVAYYVLKSRPEAWASWVAHRRRHVVLGVLVFAFSRYGRNFWQFVLESRVELRKVFWPTPPGDHHHHARRAGVRGDREHVLLDARS